MGKFIFKEVKKVFLKNIKTKIAALLVKSEIGGMKKNFDASEHGGAPLLGISKPVIKAHGSSDANAILNAVRQAENYVDTGIIYDIAAHANDFRARAEAAKNAVEEEASEE